MRNCYRVEATREGEWWNIYVPEIDYHTQATTVAEIDEMARDLIATANDVAPASFDIDVSLEKPASVAAELKRADTLDREGRTALSRAAEARRRAARSLRQDHGLSAVDTAAVLGVTRARVYQMLDA
jgi:hypothetical protein